MFNALPLTISPLAGRYLTPSSLKELVLRLHTGTITQAALDALINPTNTPLCVHQGSYELPLSRSAGARMLPEVEQGLFGFYLGIGDDDDTPELVRIEKGPHPPSTHTKTDTIDCLTLTRSASFTELYQFAKASYQKPCFTWNERNALMFCHTHQLFELLSGEDDRKIVLLLCFEETVFVMWFSHTKAPASTKTFSFNGYMTVKHLDLVEVGKGDILLVRR